MLLFKSIKGFLAIKGRISENVMGNFYCYSKIGTWYSTVQYSTVQYCTRYRSER